MKKYLILLAFGLLGSMSYAQTNDTTMSPANTHTPRPKLSPEERAAKMTDRMAQSLGLSADQKAKVLQANITMAKELDDMHKDASKSRDKRHALETEQEARLKAILTDEQFQKLMAQKAERKGKMHERHQQQPADQH